ncbi:MAG: polyprenyl synthetase family protein [Desulfobulbaceae bacterium]|nr:polyprenyl synthetase family protein [Desulfobulbaceae bacterium]
MNQSELISLLAPETVKIDQAMRHDLALVESPRLREVLEYAIFTGGKRVRPLLTILAARLCWQNQGKDIAPEMTTNLYRLALSFEYLHAASLLHDDVIDRADSRRGRPTANRLWGNSHVILAGDFLHARAMLLAGTIGGAECLSVIGSATEAMVESEFLQIDNAETQETSERRYFEVLEGKTAALIAAATTTGALFAGASLAEQQALHTFGRNLGLTFQIVDDLLDYQGDPQKTGKAIGNDFQEGKMTLPLIIALEQACPHDKTILTNLLDNTAEERQKNLPHAHQLIEKACGFEAARDKAKGLVREALTALTIFPRNKEQEIMTALAGYVLARQG